jgi:selenocysteine lyase/cysteine desulfurase
MLVLINKYLFRSNKDRAEETMHTGSDQDRTCIPGCVPVRASKRAAASSVTTTTTTARASRHNFVRAAASGLLPGARFTNHESLPALPDAYAEFGAAFPQYAPPAVRGDEYAHLDRHVCLDYTGINLFSHAQMSASRPSTSAASSSSWQPPFFDIAYKSTSLRTQVQRNDGVPDRGVGAAVTRRIMASLKIPEDEYAMVCTANRTTAFRLLAESYSFHSSGGGGKRLLTVYDYESEAASAMAESARRRGADVASAAFAWPSMRIHAADLRKKLSRRRRGLFVFPLASRMTGARYPYLWMSAARERGWHVALDACALGTKDLDTFGVSLLRPDFIVCNFFKVFGENPSGFAGIFVRKTSLAALERSVIARSIGVVSIVPARRWWSPHDDYSYSTELELEQKELERELSFPRKDTEQEFDVDTSASFSGPLSVTRSRNLDNGGDVSEEIREVEAAAVDCGEADTTGEEEEVECRGLDHADALGLVAIGNRLRCVSNWLVVALQKLRHPAGEGHQLVRVYGPGVKFERGPSLAFNVFDWKAERVAPPLVQKLADRHGISLACGFLRNIWFSDKYDADRAVVLEHRTAGGGEGSVRKKEPAAGDVGIFVVNASLGFLSNFEDAYRLWAFVAKFLDADFVEKERWRYTALNQRTVEV